MTIHRTHRTDPHADEGVLHDFVDDRLDLVARAAVQAHLDACGECAARVARIRGLLAAASALPREREPARDGWPALRAVIAQRAARPVARAGVARPRAAVRVWTALAAAALLVVAVASWERWQDGATPGAALVVAAPPASFAGVERDYAAAAAELLAQLDATRDRLPASTAAAVDRSLATIDDALAEARAALRADPDNPEIARFVTLGYERKLDLLRRTTELSSGE